MDYKLLGGEFDLKRKLLPILLLAAMIFMVAQPYSGQAESQLDKINRQIKEIEKKERDAKRNAQAAKNRLKQVKQQTEQTKQDIESILTRIEDTSVKLEALNEKISTTTTAAQKAAEDLGLAEADVEKSDTLLKTRLRLMYENGSVSYLEVLLGSTSFSDFLDRYDALQTIVDQDHTILVQNKQSRDLVQQKKSEVERNLMELKNLFAQSEDLKQQLLTKEKEKQVVIASLQQKAKDLESIKDDEEEAAIKLAAQRAALLAQKSQLSFNGIMAWPVPSSQRITSTFGARTDPFSGKLSGHKGVDIGAPNGTTIVAAADGIVIVAQYLRGYGNCVIIDHGNGIWTLYAHQRNGGIKVKQGQKVTKGQKIGEVGSTGRSTGNHLHFEVRKNEIPVDPMPYLR